MTRLFCSPSHSDCSMSCSLQSPSPSPSPSLPRHAPLLLSRKLEPLHPPNHGCYRAFFPHRRLNLSSPSPSSSAPSSSSSLLQFAPFCAGLHSQPEQSRKKVDSTTAKSARKRAPKVTDEALREDIRRFLSSQGLPLDEIPSTKDFANRGREDLAKIVKRRGYKAMNELLNENLKDGLGLAKDEVIDISPPSSEDASVITRNVDIEQSEQPANSDDIGQGAEPIWLSQRATEITQGGSLETELETPYSLNGSLMGRKVNDGSHQRAAAEFVKTGHLNCRPAIPNEEEEEEDEENEDDDSYEDSSDEEENGESSAEAIAFAKAAKLRAKLLPYLKMNAGIKPNDQPDNPDNNLNLANVGTQLSITEAEIELQRIKSDLRDKEVELAEMSRELEQTKAQLALVQAKAAVEVAQAQQVVLEKDIRLRSADRALASLKQVHVEYWGEGSTVELAGSFNGWKHFVAMKPDLTSEISKPDGSRGPLMWETELWLYPGLYEVKFIVDGNWQIDERREIVMRNSHSNNILRVDP